MPQNVAAVLAEALGRTGAAALPYAAEFRFLVEQHMTDLVSVRPAEALAPNGRRGTARWGGQKAGVLGPEAATAAAAANLVLTVLAVHAATAGPALTAHQDQGVHTH